MMTQTLRPLIWLRTICREGSLQIACSRANSFPSCNLQRNITSICLQLFNSLPSDLQEGERAFKSNAPRACSTREEGLRVTKGVQPGLKGKLTLGQPGPRHANPTLPQGTKRSKARQLHSTKGHQEVQGAPAPLYQRAPRGPRHANSTLPKDTQVQGTLIPLYHKRAARAKGGRGQQGTGSWMNVPHA